MVANVGRSFFCAKTKKQTLVCSAILVQNVMQRYATICKKTQVKRQIMQKSLKGVKNGVMCSYCSHNPRSDVEPATGIEPATH